MQPAKECFTQPSCQSFQSRFNDNRFRTELYQAYTEYVLIVSTGILFLFLSVVPQLGLQFDFVVGLQ